MQNKLDFATLKPANLKETQCMLFDVICELVFYFYML